MRVPCLLVNPSDGRAPPFDVGSVLDFRIEIAEGLFAVTGDQVVLSLGSVIPTSNAALPLVFDPAIS